MDGALEDLLKAMYKNNVVLPREFVMIGRGIAIIEDTGKKLDPKFNATVELRKQSKKIVTNRYRPEKLGKSGLNFIVQLEHLAKDLPDTINSTITKIEEGNLEVHLKLDGLSELANQLSVALVIAALIVGSSLALVAKCEPIVFGMPILGITGFVISGFLGIYLVLAYMREIDGI